MKRAQRLFHLRNHADGHAPAIYETANV